MTSFQDGTHRSDAGLERRVSWYQHLDVRLGVAHGMPPIVRHLRVDPDLDPPTWMTMPPISCAFDPDSSTAPFPAVPRTLWTCPSMAL